VKDNKNKETSNIDEGMICLLLLGFLAVEAIGAFVGDFVGAFVVVDEGVGDFVGAFVDNEGVGAFVDNEGVGDFVGAFVGDFVGAFVDDEGVGADDVVFAGVFVGAFVNVEGVGETAVDFFLAVVSFETLLVTSIDTVLHEANEIMPIIQTTTDNTVIFIFVPILLNIYFDTNYSFYQYFSILFSCIYL